MSERDYQKKLEMKVMKTKKEIVQTMLKYGNEPKILLQKKKNSTSNEKEKN